MSKTLTITLNNIPDNLLEQAWIDCKKDGKRMLGVVPLNETDRIEIDFGMVSDNYSFAIEPLAEVLAGALTCHVIMVADNILNKENNRIV